MSQKLSVTDHSRDIAGLKYIYPVISRRAGGLSIGINFNSNNACNWRCIYCQVPDLVRGSAPAMDFALLQRELRFFLQQVLEGDFYEHYNVPEHQRLIKDIAISGNGEPTSLKEFDKAVNIIGDIATEMQVLPESNFVLITNGSLMYQAGVQAGLKSLQRYQGQVWYKLDSATEQGRKKINDTKQSNKQTIENLRIAAGLCETRIQTCLVDYSQAIDEECSAYLQLLTEAKLQHIKIKNIMLYTLARPSLQPEAPTLQAVEQKEMDLFADKITALGFETSVSL